MWYAFGAIILVLAIMIPLFILQIKKAKRDQAELQKNTPIIKKNIPKIENELTKAGFAATQKYDSLGYKYFDYVTKLGCPKNLNVQLDANNKLIACFMYLPYYFTIYRYDELLKYELLVNNGEMEISTTSSSIGTSIGGIGLGNTISSGTATQTVNGIIVTLVFTDGESFALNFLNNRPAKQGDAL